MKANTATNSLICFRGIFLAATAILCVLVTAVFTAPAPAEEGAEKPESVHKTAKENGDTVRIPIEKVRTVTFMLNEPPSPKQVNGRVVAEDRNSITVAEVIGSSIVTTTYNRANIVSRSVRYDSMPEPEYWEQIGKHFMTRTWDFEDDPDDFMQALRCFERARDLVVQAEGPEHEWAKELALKAGLIQQERSRWIQEAKSRAELKQLEMEAVFEQRMSKAEAIMEQHSERLERIENLLGGEAADNPAQVQRNLATLSNQLRVEIQRNRQDISRLYALCGGGQRPGSAPQNRSSGGWQVEVK